MVKAGGEFVGTCSFEKFIVGRQGEIGFDLAKQHWGHGYMAEALDAIIAYGFNVLALVEIEAYTYSSNARARRLLENLGFQVGVVAEDSLRYTLAWEEWARTRP